MKSAVASLLLLGQQASASSSSWDYDHMSAWSDSYSMCGTSKQSPIDVKPYEAVFDSEICDSTFDWVVDTTHQTFKLSNNGHSISLKPIIESNIDPDHELETTLEDSDGQEYEPLTSNEDTIARLTNYFKPDSSDHETFCLDSFHFHWGQSDETGSEHFVDGHQYPLELHFVHYSCSHADLGTTLAQFPTQESVEDARDAGDDTYQLGVVGIFFEVTDENNPAFDAIFTNKTLDEVLFPAETEDAIVVKDLDLNDLIPEDLFTSGYYSYEGSLTTPPCTDIVRWHVMNARSYIGREQIEFFRELMANEEDPIAPNYREIQSNPAQVYGCIGEAEEEDIVADEEVTGGDEDEDKNEMSWWSVMIISSLATAVIMGAVFLYVYNKQQKEAAEKESEFEKAEMGRRKATSASGSELYGTR